MKLLLSTVALFILFSVNGVFGSPECGQVLLNKGKNSWLRPERTWEGQWPWHVALYQHTSGKGTRYICGGTLISKHHVVTAAHCAVSQTSKPINLTVYLGKHKLTDVGDKVQVVNVKDIWLHPEYNSTTFYKDLAILELRDPVTFSNWVQPACLWPDSEIDFKNILENTGSVVSWGINETGEGVEELSLLRMPVASQVMCRFSNPEFFARFLSASTYCAGTRRDCAGDSGDGMVFEKDGTWYLRGVRSLTVAEPNGYRCDPTQYMIFADVAQALPWIKKYIY